MSRTCRKMYQPSKIWAFLYDDVPRYRMMQWLARMNPPPSFRRMWRRLHRARANRALRQAEDYDSMQVPVKLDETTTEMDWY